MLPDGPAEEVQPELPVAGPDEQDAAAPVDAAQADAGAPPEAPQDPREPMLQAGAEAAAAIAKRVTVTSQADEAKAYAAAYESFCRGMALVQPPMKPIDPNLHADHRGVDPQAEFDAQQAAAQKDAELQAAADQLAATHAHEAEMQAAQHAHDAAEGNRQRAHDRKVAESKPTPEKTLEFQRDESGRPTGAKVKG